MFLSCLNFVSKLYIIICIEMQSEMITYSFKIYNACKINILNIGLEPYSPWI